MNKILSIVIPTYNMEKYLHRCLDSLVFSDRSLFDKLEVIVVNDGSKDSSSEIAHEYERLYPSIFRIIDKENGNYGSCVNIGLDEAQGLYFRILDADDFFVPSSLALFIEYIISLKDKPELLVTNFQEDYVTRKSHVSNDIGGYKYDTLYNFKDIDFSKGTMSIMHRMTYKLETIKQSNLRHLEGISYTDSEYCFYPLWKVKSVMFVNILLYCYQHGRDEQTVSKSSMHKNIHQLRLIIDRMLDYIGNDNDGQYYINNSKVVLFRNLSIYYTTLLTDKFPNKEDLSGLDKRLQNHFSALHKELGLLKKSYVPFVKLWRNGKKTNEGIYNMIFKLYDWNVLIFHKIR